MTCGRNPRQRRLQWIHSGTLWLTVHEVSDSNPCCGIGETGFLVFYYCIGFFLQKWWRTWKNVLSYIVGPWFWYRICLLTAKENGWWNQHVEKGVNISLKRWHEQAIGRLFLKKNHAQQQRLCVDNNVEMGSLISLSQHNIKTSRVLWSCRVHHKPPRKALRVAAENIQFCMLAHILRSFTENTLGAYGRKKTLAAIKVISRQNNRGHYIFPPKRDIVFRSNGAAR